MTDLPESLKTFDMRTADPLPAWKDGRERCPVRMADPHGAETVHVFQRDHALQVLRDDETFSASCNGESMRPYMGEIILAKDGKEHTLYRNLVSHAFRASALARWEKELIAPTIDGLLDEIAPKGHADLVLELSRPYPAKVIAGIMGVAVADHEQFSDWAVAINMGPLAPEAGRVASRAMREYLTPIVEDRRCQRRDDLISDIVYAEVNGERLDDEHIYGFLRLLMPAGAETTYREMGILLVALLENPLQLARLRADKDLLPDFIEETLRWNSSAPMVARVATRDTEIGGCPIAKGTRISMSLGSANRDESVYDHAADWDPERPSAPGQLAFGWGRHVCLGMHLARLELRVGIGAVLDRLKNLRFDPDEPAPQIEGTAFRGPDRLPVLFDPSTR